MRARPLERASTPEPCESGCGARVRVTQYQGGEPALTEYPPHPGRRHTPERCQERRADRAAARRSDQRVEELAVRYGRFFGDEPIPTANRDRERE